jgi:hypothetical protein
MATHHLPSIVTKIITIWSHVAIHIKWNQRMNLYLLTFYFIQYPLSFMTNIICDFVTKKKGVLPTHDTSTAFNEPLTPNLIMIFSNTYRSPIFIIHGLSTDCYVCTLQIINTQHTTTGQTSQYSYSCLPHTHTDARQGHFHIALQIMYTPKAQALFLSDVTNLQISQHCPVSLSLSLSRIFCSSVLTKLPGAAEKVKHLAKVA